MKKRKRVDVMLSGECINILENDVSNCNMMCYINLLQLLLFGKLKHAR